MNDNDNTTPFVAPILHHADNLDVIHQLPNESVDVILTDPPYLYLKKQRLERPFNEEAFFTECRRVLTKKGFIVLFGRGTSFYRWNTILDNLGFEFKEEIVWDKSHCSSPLMKLSRVHETVSIHTKDGGTINKVKIPYLEMKGHDIGAIKTDIKRLLSVFSNAESMKAVLYFLENNIRDVSDSWKANDLSISSSITKENRCVSVVRSLEKGLNEKSIVRVDFVKEMDNKSNLRNGKCNEGNRAVNTIQGIEIGLNEKSIITPQETPDSQDTILKEIRDHYTAIHPTQKPVRLLERLLQLVIPQDKERSEITVLDPFAGSMSTMEACLNMGLKGIGIEIDDEYFHQGQARIEAYLAQMEEQTMKARDKQKKEKVQQNLF